MPKADASSRSYGTWDGSCILGVLPLVTSTGSGSEMRQAVGVAVFFGMLGVTVFGLVFTPNFYVLMRSLVSKSA
jgi:multidrug efflux pump